MILPNRAYNNCRNLVFVIDIKSNREGTRKFEGTCLAYRKETFYQKILALKQTKHLKEIV